METVSVIRQSRMKTKISMDMNEHKNVEIEKKTHTNNTGCHGMAVRDGFSTRCKQVYACGVAKKKCSYID